MKLVVLGGGESGVGAALLGKRKGYEVFLSDKGSIAGPYKRVLLESAIDFEEGRHSENRIYEADIVIKSPGIPDNLPMIVHLREQGVEVISEIEFAGRYSSAKYICITGSNGKTTTTLLIHHILTKAGIDAGLAGNVGRSLAAQVAEDAHGLYVVELSSFQLDGMFQFRADIAILTNITPDHLDRYEYKFENYIDRCSAAKIGVYETTVQDMYTDYLKPQECGNRTGVRKAVISGEKRKFAFAAEPVCEMNASCWLPKEIEAAWHKKELPPSSKTVLRIIARQQGVGGYDSWGAKPNEKYLNKAGRTYRLKFRIIF